MFVWQEAENYATTFISDRATFLYPFTIEGGYTLSPLQSFILAEEVEISPPYGSIDISTLKDAIISKCVESFSDVFISLSLEATPTTSPIELEEFHFGFDYYMTGYHPIVAQNVSNSFSVKLFGVLRVLKGDYTHDIGNLYYNGRTLDIFFKNYNWTVTIKGETATLYPYGKWTFPLFNNSVFKHIPDRWPYWGERQWVWNSCPRTKTPESAQLYAYGQTDDDPYSRNLKISVGWGTKAIINETVKESFNYLLDITPIWKRIDDALFICIDNCDDNCGFATNKLTGKWIVTAGYYADFGQPYFVE